MRVLITGGAGFIGSHAAEALLRAGHSVWIVDNLSTGRQDSVPAAAHFLKGSIGCDAFTGAAFDWAKPEVVLHAAASYKDPSAWQEDSYTNVLGTATVIKHTKRVKCSRMIYLQTALCYGLNPPQNPIQTTCPLAPYESSYAISKTAGENYIRLSGLDWVSFRLANMYGPRNLSGPVPTFYKRLKAGQACTIADARRDFVFVDDLVELIVLACQGAGRGAYHVASGTDRAIVEMYDALVGALGIQGAERVVTPRGADDAKSLLLDPIKTEEQFCWAASTPLAQGIKKAVEWYERNGVDQTYTHLRVS